VGHEQLWPITFAPISPVAKKRTEKSHPTNAPKCEYRTHYKEKCFALAA